MPLFTRNREKEVQGFVLKLVNNNCSEMQALMEGPRLDRRVNLTVVVMLIPLDKNRPQVNRASFVTTKEFSGMGVGLVVNGPQPLEDAVLGFRWETEMKFVRAKAKHLNPLGGGFYQFGVQMNEVLCQGDYPELESISF